MTRPWARAIGVALATAAGAMTVQGQQPYAGLGAGSVPREKIVKYAPPALPPAVTRRIQAMLDVRGAALGLIAPDGKHLYFTWAVTGTPNVCLLDGARSFPLQMTGGEDPTRVAGITPDGKWLIVARDVGGQENPGLYLQPAEGGPLTVVQHKPATQTIFGFATENSASIYFASNDVKPDSYAIYRYDIASRARTLVFDQPGLWRIADHREQAGGHVTLLLAKATGALSREYLLYDVDTRAATPLLGQGEKTEYQVAFAHAAGEYVVLTNKLGEFRRLYRWKPGADLVPITPQSRMDVVDVQLDDARTRMYYTLNDGGYQRLKVLDGATLKELPIPVPGDAASVSTGSASPDGRFVTVSVENARAPRTSYVFDWKDGTLTPWALASAPEVVVWLSAPSSTVPGLPKRSMWTEWEMPLPGRE